MVRHFRFFKFQYQASAFFSSPSTASFSLSQRPLAPSFRSSMASLALAVGSSGHLLLWLIRPLFFRLYPAAIRRADLLVCFLPWYYFFIVEKCSANYSFLRGFPKVAFNYLAKICAESQLFVSISLISGYLTRHFQIAVCLFRG
jgi:hypothetical protein